mmetsp:Transcript_49493/g.82295  ORF Transcript_49493/g.82295 Transcript_49493/m.82295 type:complete len:188 (+) Transcript_49493:35-598(+)
MSLPPQIFVSAFPPPPAYFRLYEEDGPPSPKRRKLPPPPELPPPGNYTMFGETYTTEDKLPSLADDGRQQLYSNAPDADMKQELRKLVRSLLLHSLRLVDVLVEHPSQFRTKVQDIELLLVNVHHLLNSFRPHQARELVIDVLRAQINRKKELTQLIQGQSLALSELKERVESMGIPWRQITSVDQR